MLRLKVTAVSLVVLGALLFGSVVAYAGWGWNAKADIEGTKISNKMITGTAVHNTSSKVLCVVLVGVGLRFSLKRHIT